MLLSTHISIFCLPLSYIKIWRLQYKGPAVSSRCETSHCGRNTSRTFPMMGFWRWYLYLRKIKLKGHREIYVTRSFLICVTLHRDFFFLWCCSQNRAWAACFEVSRSHTIGHTHGRTALNAWSTGRKSCQLHIKHNRRTSISSGGFEPRYQHHVAADLCLNKATGIGTRQILGRSNQGR
jgi:hypothetical protein